MSSIHLKSKNVRSITVNGEPWFYAKDVCKELGIEDIQGALSSLDSLHKTRVSIRDFDQPDNLDTLLINELGIYSLMFDGNEVESHE